MDDRLMDDDQKVVTRTLGVIAAIAKDSRLTALKTHLANNCDAILELYEEESGVVKRHAGKVSKIGLSDS